MRTIDLPSWSDFADAIARLREEYGSYAVDPGGEHEHEVTNPILFRGQSNSDWTLDTTLERTIGERISISHYLQRADSVVNEIESFTVKDWQLPSWPDIREEIATVQDSLRAHLPCYDYLVYLRHHGFPSPLLDWSGSPYIAAYFAMEQSCNLLSAGQVRNIRAISGGPDVVDPRLERGRDLLVIEDGGLRALTCRG